MEDNELDGHIIVFEESLNRFEGLQVVKQNAVKQFENQEKRYAHEIMRERTRYQNKHFKKFKK